MAPAEVLEAWEQAAGPFWQYVAGQTFATPLRVRAEAGPVRAAGRLVDRQLLPLVREPRMRQLVVLDLPTRWGLATAPAWHAAGWLVVPMCYRFGAEPAVLGRAAVLRQLVALAPLVGTVREPEGVALLLDGDRCGPATAAVPGCFDDRYRYLIHLFPQARALQDWAVGRVWIVHGLPGPAEDLAHVLGHWNTAMNKGWRIGLSRVGSSWRVAQLAGLAPARSRPTSSRAFPVRPTRAFASG